MIIVGVDNGLSGGLVALSDHPGPPIEMMRMPVSIVKGKNEIDAIAVDKWLAKFNGPISVLIEAPNNAKTPSTAASMAASFHAIRVICDLRQYRCHRITPQSWQKEMIPGCDKGETKPAALSKARQLWPMETWIATEKSSKPHEGLIDAALIAEYGRIKNL